MPQHRVLYLDAAALGASLWQAGALREEARFPAGDDGHAAFAQYVAAHPGTHFHLLVDLAEEGFQVETVPYALGADRSALLARRLGQHFYGSPLACAISYGREKEGRRDEKFLFTALTRPQTLEPWLAALREAEAQLAGIHSVPLLGAAALAKAGPARANCLLVTATRAGVRQSYFEEGRIRFSRMTPMPRAGFADIAKACAAESANMYQYLIGQRVIPRGAPLVACVLAHPDQRAEFAEACRDGDDLRFEIVDLPALSRACGLATPPADSRCEALFQHLLAQRPPREQFAPPAERRFFRLWQIRSVLVRGAAALLAVCLLYAGKQLFDAIELHGRTSTIAAQAQADAARYGAIQQTFPPAATSSDNLRAVMNRYAELERRSPPLETLYLAVSRALQHVPAVEIERIDWAAGDTGPEPGEARPGAAADRAADRAGGASQSALIHGALPVALAADQRAQLDLVDRFEAALRADAALRVQIQRRPFDIESGKSLKSGGDTPAVANPPRFVVQIGRKL